MQQILLRSRKGPFDVVSAEADPEDRAWSVGDQDGAQLAEHPRRHAPNR